MSVETTELNNSYNYIQSVLYFLNPKKISNGLGHCFAHLSAISDDRQTLTKVIRNFRHVFATYFLTYGEHRTLHKIDKRWKYTVDFLEGIQFIKSLAIFFPEPNENESEETSPSTFFAYSMEKVTKSLSSIGDLAGGCIWLLDLNVPILGPYSSSAKVAAFIAKAAEGIFLIGYFAESALILNRIKAIHIKVNTEKDRSNENLNLLRGESQLDLLKLAENVTGAAYLIFSIMGVPFLTIGFGIASTTIGVGSFIYERHMNRAMAQTV